MYNGIAGGIGEGLQSFVSAYQQALNYRLEKQKAASMADYQQQMAHAADVNAKAGLLTAWGPEAVAKYDPDPNSIAADKANSNVDSMMQGMQNVGPPAAPDPESQPGFIGPPKPPGMLPQPDQSSPPPPPPGGLAGSPMWQRKAMFEQNLASQKELNDLTLKAKESGNNFQYAIDPKTGRPAVTGQGPLTGNAALERQQKEAQIGGEVSGSRSPKQTIVDDFNKQSQFAQQSSIYTAQAIQAFKDPSPHGDEAMITLAYKIHFPNSPDVPTLKAMSESQSIPDTIRQAAYQKINGGVDPETKKNVLRDILATNKANFGTLQEMKSGFKDRFAGSHVNDLSGLNTPSIDKTYQSGTALDKEIGPFVPNSERPNAGFLTKALSSWGGGAPATAAQSQDPKISAWAQQHKLDYGAAENILRKRGYGQ